jgi:hypothetical protein
MKRVVILIGLVMTHQAFSAKNMTYSWAGGKDTTKVGFSLRNKSGKDIYVTAENDSLLRGSNIASQFLQKHFGEPDLYLLKNNKFLDLQLNIEKPTKLTLYDCASLDGCDIKKARKVIQATFTPNKTIYINWDGSKLYKQRGPLKGLGGKVKDAGEPITNLIPHATDQGYNLSNNVDDNDIKKIK